MFSNKYSSPPPSYTSNSDNYKSNTDNYKLNTDNYKLNTDNYKSNKDNYKSNIIKFTTYSSEYIPDYYSGDYNIRSPKYHGPVQNTECDILRITTEKYDTKTGKKSKDVSYINKNNLDNFSYPRKEVYVSGLEPIPNYLINNYKSRNHFFQEQKRLLLNKQLDERLRLEAQRVYPSISFNN